MILPLGPVKTGIELITAKKCSCCNRTHKFIPKTAPFTSSLYWWDCACNSTLCATKDMVKK